MLKLKNELNIKVILIGIILSMIMGAANVYMGLKAGMTVSASIPASVIGMLILKYINKILNRNKEFTLEANQIQTAASAGESLAAGIIFTMPALIIIGAWQEFNLILTAVIAFTGGLLGILFMIPMREVFINKNNSNLKYPEGIACASVLEAGKKSNNSKSAQLIIEGSFVGALFKYLISFVGAIKSTLEFAFVNNNKIFYFGSDISPALVAVGYIVKINIAILVFIGGFIAWIIAMPLFGQGNTYINEPLLGAWTIWSTKIRYIGVGAMIVGGIASIYKVRLGLIDAIKILFTSKSTKNYKNRNLSSKKINFFSSLAIFLVASVYYYLTNNITITVITTITMVIMSFFFTAVASYIVGLVGNSNSPVSGMTITAVMFTGGLLYVFGYSGMNGMIATLGVAAIVCCAACTSGDVCNDLKTGQIVGATPYKQQIMQIIGVAFAAIVMGPTLQLLHNNTPGGIGGRELAAPQAGLFASLVKGFFGNGELPWILVVIGAFIGTIIILLDFLLEKQDHTFRLHIMPVAVGMYLPFGLSIPIFLGGLISYLIDKNYFDKNENKTNIDNGILLSSGIIAGESLMGIFLAIMFSFGISNSISLETNITLIFSIMMLYYLFKRAK